jgi:hypothetical protein
MDSPGCCRFHQRSDRWLLRSIWSSSSHRRLPCNIRSVSTFSVHVNNVHCRFHQSSDRWLLRSIWSSSSHRRPPCKSHWVHFLYTCTLQVPSKVHVIIFFSQTPSLHNKVSDYIFCTPVHGRFQKRSDRWLLRSIWSSSSHRRFPCKIRAVSTFLYVYIAGSIKNPTDGSCGASHPCMQKHTDLRAHISGRQTPGSTRGSYPFLYNKCGGLNPGLNPGFDVLRCGPLFGTIWFGRIFLAGAESNPSVARYKENTE